MAKFLNMTFVCVTGNEQNTIALEQRIEKVMRQHRSLLCELRLDHLDLTPAAAFAFVARIPAEWAPRIILTQRLKVSGPVANGGCTWSIPTWQSWWKDVMALRPWFAVDLDWIIVDRLAGEGLGWGGRFRSRNTFFSLHGELKDIEEQIPFLLESAKEHEAGVKIAAPVDCMSDLHRMADFAARLEDLPFHIAVAMGATGRIWRWSKLVGDLSYFAYSSETSTALGQEPFAEILPYTKNSKSPDLYVLLGDDAGNLYGEKQWNRVFLARGANARYVNLATEPEDDWPTKTKLFLERAGIIGASVTKPYKQEFQPASNLLRKDALGWHTANTDGPGVAQLLASQGFSAGTTVLIAGGGGAAKTVGSHLEAKKFLVTYWVRENGKLPAISESAQVFISTWPGNYQADLVPYLANHSFDCVIDAQISQPVNPLRTWCAEKGIPYVPGTSWWKAQARLQDIEWFGEDRLGLAKEKILTLVPLSKSETIRALAIAAAFGVETEIVNPSVCEDTEVFTNALEKLGVSFDWSPQSWHVIPPLVLKCPKEPIFMGDGATGFRFLSMFSVLFSQGELQLDGSAQLRKRPMEDLEQFFSADSSWPIKVPNGKPIPAEILLSHTSQFASGLLIVAAALVYQGKLPEYQLTIRGERKSETYLQLTLSLLQETGLRIIDLGASIVIRPGEKKKKFTFQIERDASALAFLEVLFRKNDCGKVFLKESRQGDAVFPDLLQRLRAGEEIFSLRSFPDLAPPLWAAAVLWRKKIIVRDCPQLHAKESDRAAALVDAAQKLAVPAEVFDDGFMVDFREFVWPVRSVQLDPLGDHRLAMAFGIVGSENSSVQSSHPEVVKKSFPKFWEALQLLGEALPG